MELKLKETEAKKKWCPMARVIDIKSEVSWNRIKRAVGIDTVGAKCIASECMLWVNRTSDNTDKSGYCGLING